MADPLFDSFREPVEVSPPDPGVIRRRGERRGRRTAVATVAGVAIVLAGVVVPVAALTGGDEQPAPPVTTPSSTGSPKPGGPWLHAIPEDFPLGDGLPMPGEGEAGTRHGEGTTVTACGAEVWSADRPQPWSDVATATNADVVEAADGNDSRTLALYSDDRTATVVETSIAAALAACPTRKTGETVERIGEGAWVVDRSPSDGELITVTRVGNAVMLQRDGFGAAGPGNVDQELTHIRQGQASVVAAMCVFAAGSCPRSTPPATQSTEAGVPQVAEIPADFPIDVGHLDPGSDGTVSAPSRNGERVVFDPCGAEAFAVPERDRLAFQVTGPEYADTRELRTYPSADDAVTQMQRLRDAVGACPRQGSSESGGAARWSTHPVDTGYDSVAVAQTYEQGLGGGVWLFTRVGRSILALATGGEYSADNVWDALPTLVDRAGQITPSMCRFTVAGC